MTFLGMSVDKAEQLLNRQGYDYELIPYLGVRPYEKADTSRIVREKRLSEKKFQLVYSNFISVPTANSQD